MSIRVDESKSIQQSDKDVKHVAKHFEKEASVQLKEFREINYILVAAIDFGSTYSGYAFSTRLSFQTRPLEMSSAVWPAGAMQSLKTATCVLFKPDKSFHSFGFKAENHYAELTEENKHQGWYFFRRFKMQLYKAKKVQWDIPLSSIDGKTLPALKVFTACIKYLKDQMLEQCGKQGLDIRRTDIRWVVTVPAIWSDDAKQFMRRAAEQADIPGPQLFLALEAEAAALYCKHLPIEKLTVKPEDHMHVFSPATTYMILDVGGGTVDITVHEVRNDLTLKEVHMATGGNWGGLKVDDAFESLLLEMVGQETFTSFKKNHPSDFLDLLRSFEIKKRTIQNDGKKITFAIPISLTNTYTKIHSNKCIADELSNNPKFSSDVSWKGDKLRISNSLARSLFDASLDHIKEHLQELLLSPEVEGISAVLMVGGFSECPLLQSMVKENIHNKRLIVPNEAGLAVLKGAVINGHAPDTVTERICRYSYGVSTSRPFIEGKHNKDYAFSCDRGLSCSNLFSIHLQQHQPVPLFIPGKTVRYVVVNKDQKTLEIEVFISTEKDPTYTTEESCHQLGKLSIEMGDTRRGLERGVDVTMTLGGAELQVKAVDIYTQEKRFVYFDFIGSPSDEALNALVQ